MTNASNLRDTIIPKSDQLNAEQLLSGPITVVITSVVRGNAEQPVIVHYQNEDGLPYKPCKSMRKVLVFAWGDDGAAWVGKSLTLYNDPEVKFGGVKVGGIRISHMSGIRDDITLSLTATRGKKETFTIRRMVEQTEPQILTQARAKAAEGLDALKAWREGLNQAEKRALVPYTDELKGIAAGVQERATDAA